MSAKEAIKEAWCLTEAKQHNHSPKELISYFRNHADEIRSEYGGKWIAIQFPNDSRPPEITAHLEHHGTYREAISKFQSIIDQTDSGIHQQKLAIIYVKNTSNNHI